MSEGSKSKSGKSTRSPLRVTHEKSLPTGLQRRFAWEQ